MIVTAPARPYSGTMDLDEFMAFLEMRPKEERWDLIEGVAVMMAPPSMAHQWIARNLCELLNTAFAAQGSNLLAYHEIALRLPGLLNFQPEPDVVVAPGPAGPELYTQDFRLVAEILSPSNRRTEIDLKLHRYRQAASNLYVVVVEPHETFVEIYAKSREWEPAALRRRDDPIEMPEFGFRCSVGDLYRGTTLDPESRGS
ncbi:MAG TPA: Uma2 family endonuclease [Xanthobacteraceae bacterium]|jgi:Uma2 family endonuclease